MQCILALKLCFFLSCLNVKGKTSIVVAFLHLSNFSRTSAFCFCNTVLLYIQTALHNEEQNPATAKWKHSHCKQASGGKSEEFLILYQKK